MAFIRKILYEQISIKISKILFLLTKGVFCPLKIFIFIHQKYQLYEP